MSVPFADILDLARWAPSGDNTQPWRFAVESPDRLAIIGRDTREHCVYDLDGHGSQVSLGALLETLALAATRFGFAVRFLRRRGSPEDAPVFEATFSAAPAMAEDPLVAAIEARRVHRGPLGTRALTLQEKDVLGQSVAPGYAIRWFEGWRGRHRVARFNFRSARIRLTIPEAYRTHRAVIQWRARQSADRIPDAALGASGPTLMLMRWAMADWGRVDRLNRFFAGTLAPRVELDYVPGVACAAHWMLVADDVPRSLDDHVAAGRAVQRFWLSATTLGLQCQPAYTPIVFARYARESVCFTQRADALARAAAIARELGELAGADVAPRVVFMGRIGSGRPCVARSLRLPTQDLMVARLPEAARAPASAAATERVDDRQPGDAPGGDQRAAHRGGES
ncbi:MAG TPA: molybdopterin biosynthesis protein MoeY [Casimicrobiaceae bacterium]|nr:molybdopterin biosynthesis protein MoeY [Casimicrobiaceae bacterium]